MRRLIRQSRGFDTAAKTVRDELKAGREEARQVATRLREELVVGLKAGHDTPGRLQGFQIGPRRQGYASPLRGPGRLRAV